MLRKFAPGLIGLLALNPTSAFASTADADCKLRIEASPSEWRVPNIDVFATDPTLATFQVQLINDGAGTCRVRLSLDTLGAPFGVSKGGGKRIPYSVIERSSGVDLSPRAGKSVLRSRALVTIAPHSEQVAQFDVALPPSFETDGSYSQVINLSALGDSDSDIVAFRPVTLVANAASSATMALSGDFTRVGGIADVDLGNLEDRNHQPQLILHVRSTRAYNIRSSSQNSGKLVLSGTNWSIRYKLSIDGVTLDANGGTYQSTSGERSRADNLKLGFTVTGETDVEAGRYSDIVTLEIGVI